MKAITFITLAAAGAGAIYFLDQKQGKKRRAKVRKQFERSLDLAQDYWDEYSPELRKRAGQLSHEVGKRAGQFSQEFGKRAGELYGDFSKKAGVYTRDWGEKAGELSKDYADRATDYAINDHFNWTPSARLATAVGSALAVYSAGRGGFLGTLLRTISLGMFVRALISSR